jgi:putative endonuclease
MYDVYILYSQKDKKLYVGQTTNLKKRIAEHTDGKVKSTRNRRPLVLIYKESFSTRYDAMRREKFLKSLYGARFKQRILKNYLNQKISEILI